MNSSTITSSDPLTCQEDLFSAATAIEILGIFSATSLVGLLGLLLYPARLARKKNRDSRYKYRYDLVQYTAGGFGVLGAAAGVIGIVANLILGPIILAECGTDDYTFDPSILFSAALGILVVGTVPSVILWFTEKKKAFFAVLITFVIIAGIAYFGGSVASLFHWSKYTRTLA